MTPLKMKDLTNSEKKTDCGHYVDCAIPRGPQVLEVSAGERFRRLFILDSSCPGLPFSSIVAREGADVDICILVMPGTDVEVPLYVDLAGEGAKVSLSGAWLCGAREKVSFTVVLRHRVGNCCSEQLFNGLAGGNSRTAFHGRILVAPDAQQTKAFQTNHNILLSDSAKVQTKPQLEIYADDVQCSHGATVGSLNPDEQFYMRSRGIPEAEAKILQMVSFLAPVLAHVEDPLLREELLDRMQENLRGII